MTEQPEKLTRSAEEIGQAILNAIQQEKVLREEENRLYAKVKYLTKQLEEAQAELAKIKRSTIGYVSPIDSIIYDIRTEHGIKYGWAAYEDSYTTELSDKVLAACEQLREKP